MAFNEPLTTAKLDEWPKQVSCYGISESEHLTPAGKTIFSMIDEILDRYHYDNSNAMIDYFETNFYKKYSIGQYDKTFQLI